MPQSKPKRPDAASAEHAFLGHAVAMLVGQTAAKKAGPAVEQAFALAKKGSDLKQAGDPDALSRRITVRVDGADGGRPQSVSAGFSARTLVDSGPKKRKPVRVGGTACITVRLGPLTITVCYDWSKDV